MGEPTGGYFSSLAGRLAGLAQSVALCDLLGRGGQVQVRGLHGSLPSLLISGLRGKLQGVAVVVATDAESAGYYYSDLSGLVPEASLFFFPSSYRGTLRSTSRRMEGVIQRMEVVSRQADLQAGRLAGGVVVTYLEALAERFAPAGEVSGRSLELRLGENYPLVALADTIEGLGFARVEFVYEPGQFAVRGSIVDVFSLQDTHPYRLDFLGDTLDSIRQFDVETQLSVSRVESVTITPDLGGGRGPDATSLLQILPCDTCVWGEELAEGIRQYADRYEGLPEEEREAFVPPESLRALLSGFPLAEMGLEPLGGGGEPVVYHASPQPPFNKNFQLLRDTILDDRGRGVATVIVAEQATQLERLRGVMGDLGLEAEAYALEEFSLRGGFCSADLRVNVYTDHQIFARYHRYKLRKELPRRDALSERELSSLHVGDYVVHVDHGVGRFEGLVRTQERGVMQEYVRLSYRDKDTLLVSIHNLHRLSKYRGKEGEPPTINKLGSGAWNRMKQRVKGKVKDIARDLIALYAQRRAQRGFAFSHDSYMQEELESSFIYQDTPDQLLATQAVKADMESDVPMDRLVCGDVGFGKTEIAIRAAFKAVADSKQVAVLVPTTVLALQHYKTFSSRLADFPVRVEFVSRLKSAGQQKELLKELAEGRIDIMIGTHALLRDRVVFKDLGLLIVDEEQKFGVAAKERLKKLRMNVDTLTMTATPIPRTLQFSLMGARDLSIISTPPPNRYPIHTEVCTFDEDKIRAAIRYEIERGGQVFFVHNRVQNLEQIHSLLLSLLPGVRCVMAHGQMRPQDIERVMLDFMAGDYDVLLSTSIIESGLDIPNANTIIINNGHRFGLSDLHQLRGRVGRTNRKAYCYILAPMTEVLTSDARRRLRAIEEFSELGSGMDISMQDLDIRGAGNLLGAEQSGFIVDLGFETYQRILDEAVRELKMGEFSDMFEEAASEAWRMGSTDCQVETDLDISLPESFVSSSTERIRLYREIDTLRNRDELERYVGALRDRFGELPPQAQALVAIPPLKWLAGEIGVEKLQLIRKVLRLQFVTPIDSPFYASDIFGKILANVQRGGERYSMRQTESSLRLEVRGVSGVEEALGVMEGLKG